MLEATVDTRGLLCSCLFIALNEIRSDSLEITHVLKAKNSIFHYRGFSIQYRSAFIF